MNKFRQWYLRNGKEITWFLIGFLTMGGIDALGRHEYISALITFAIAYLNYYLDKKA